MSSLSLSLSLLPITLGSGLDKGDCLILGNEKEEGDLDHPHSLPNSDQASSPTTVSLSLAQTIDHLKQDTGTLRSMRVAISPAVLPLFSLRADGSLCVCLPCRPP